ncbi:unnamed protein product [Effrenium voratum]|nr:unnamed protein product [Effrenium voratum]
MHLTMEGGPLTIGRAHQADDFEKLIPDEALRSCLSRNHFTMSFDGRGFILKRLSANAMFLDEAMIPQQQDVPLRSGALIGLSSEANGKSSFLVFRFLPKGQESPNTEAPTQQPSWSASLAGMPFYLLCTMSMSRDMLPLRAEQRAVPLPPRGTLILGRQHQPGFFEGIIGAESPNLTFISRSHLEVNELGPASFAVRNLSQNPIVVKQQQLVKEQQSFLSPGDCIEFIAGSDLKCFLRLTLEQAPRATITARPAQPGSFWLELTGSAVKPEVPVEQLRVHSQASNGRNSLVVGRAFQHELHQVSLNEDALAWVSREHFRIQDTAGGFELTAVSSNPMWLQHGGELMPLQQERERRQDLALHWCKRWAASRSGQQRYRGLGLRQGVKFMHRIEFGNVYLQEIR